MTDRERFIHRTLNVSASQYEKDLSRALLGILSRKAHDLPGIVAGLNATEIRPEGASEWTEQVFVSEIERLGVYPNTVGAALGLHASGVVPPGASTAERPKRGNHG